MFSFVAVLLREIFQSRLVFWSEKAHFVLHCGKRFNFQAYIATFTEFLICFKKNADVI